MRWILLFVALAVGGCSGDFAGMLTTGSIGNSASGEVAGTLRQIRVPQLAGESLESVQNKALVEAAKQARLANATHFVVVRTDEAGAPTLTLDSLTKSRPDFQVYIRLITLAPDATPPTGAVSVEEIERYVAAQRSEAKPTLAKPKS
jgi:hypothetical protein